MYLDKVLQSRCEKLQNPIVENFSVCLFTFLDFNSGKISPITTKVLYLVKLHWFALHTKNCNSVMHTYSTGTCQMFKRVTIPLIRSKFLGEFGYFFKVGNITLYSKNNQNITNRFFWGCIKSLNTKDNIILMHRYFNGIYQKFKCITTYIF